MARFDMSLMVQNQMFRVLEEILKGSILSPSPFSNCLVGSNNCSSQMSIYSWKDAIYLSLSMVVKINCLRSKKMVFGKKFISTHVYPYQI
jgi:hypothetical protein